MIVGQLLPHRLSYLGKAHSRLDVALTYTDMPYHHSRRDQKGSVNQLKRQENLIRRKKKYYLLGLLSNSWEHLEMKKFLAYARKHGVFLL